MSRLRRRPCALSIAGSDSGGGAGIQADIRTFSAFGVHPLTALVAITAQNTVEVAEIHQLTEALVLAQIRTVIADMPVSAAKTGMLADSSLVRSVARAVRELELPNLVVDPVITSKSGASLLSEEGVQSLRRELLPLARMVTPNLPEAEALVGHPLETIREIQEAAREIHSWGPDCVVIKGGHRHGEPMDLLYDGSGFILFQGERIHTASDHGTGCTFSAAIAAMLAKRAEPGEAVGEAKRYVSEAMRRSSPLGSGHGPLDHFFFLESFG
jgi:hydroxymethylpyrimidine/phosphomethylpyrimidine kinase